MRVSNWIDLVCQTFDEEYEKKEGWGRGPRAKNEPKAPAGVKPSLRSLYAFWIDQELASIETRTAAWAADVKKGFDKKWPNLKGAEKKWRDDAFGLNPADKGFIHADKFKLPRPSSQAPPGVSVYGAYAMPGFTADANGVRRDIGKPVIIP
jgi:hypothetical protein